MNVSVAQKVVSVALAVGVGGAGVAMIRTKLGCAPDTCSAPALPDLGASQPPVYPTLSSPGFDNFGTVGSAPPITSPNPGDADSGPLFGLPGTVNPRAAAPDFSAPGEGEYGSADSASEPQAMNAPIASEANPGSAPWNSFPMSGDNDSTLSSSSANGSIDSAWGNQSYAYEGDNEVGSAAPVDQPGAPAPEEMASDEAVGEVAASESAVGDGDTIDDHEQEGDSLGMSGTGEGGGGTGEGIGLGQVGIIGDPDIFNRKSGGGLGNISSAASPQHSAAGNSNVESATAEVGTTESATADGELAEVDRKLARLPIGNIAFNTPETIPLGDSATIELVLSLREAQAELRKSIRAAGPVETDDVKISDQMDAKLTGLGFRIEAVTPERQAISHTERTQWKWQIEPTKAAKLELNLTLSALIEVKGVPSTRAIQTFARTIYVEVPMGQRVSNLLSNNFELITSVLLVPAAGGIYHQYRKRKRRQVSPDDSTPTRKAA